MKKLFESPAFALLLAVIVVIGSTLLNTRIKFGRKCDAMCDEFYEQSDIAAELRNFCAAAEKVDAGDADFQRFVFQVHDDALCRPQSNAFHPFEGALVAIGNGGA